MKEFLCSSLVFLLVIISPCYGQGPFGIVTGQYGPSLASIMKFGENAAVGLTYEDIGGVGGDLTYLTSPTALEVLSDDVDDTAAGTGARTVKIYTLDGNYDFQTETVSLDGTTPVALTLSALRVWRCKVETAGTSESAEGSITIRVAGAGVSQAIIVNGIDKNNQTLTTLFTIPDGYWGLICCVFSGCKKGNDAEVSFQVREPGSVFQTKHHLTVYERYVVHTYRLPRKYPPKSDIRIRAKSPGGPIHMTAGYTLLLVHEDRVSLFPGIED